MSLIWIIIFGLLADKCSATSFMNKAIASLIHRPCTVVIQDIKNDLIQESK